MGGEGEAGTAGGQADLWVSGAGGGGEDGAIRRQEEGTGRKGRLRAKTRKCPRQG